MPASSVVRAYIWRHRLISALVGFTVLLPVLYLCVVLSAAAVGHRAAVAIAGSGPSSAIKSRRQCTHNQQI